MRNFTEKTGKCQGSLILNAENSTEKRPLEDFFFEMIKLIVISFCFFNAFGRRATKGETLNNIRNDARKL